MTDADLLVALHSPAGAMPGDYQAHISTWGHGVWTGTVTWPVGCWSWRRKDFTAPTDIACTAAMLAWVRERMEATDDSNQ